MKRKDLQALKEKSIIDLRALVAKRKSEIEKGVKTPKNLRIEIARMLTFVREKEIVEKLKQ